MVRDLTILDHSVIPFDIYKKSEELCKDIDPDDTAFVALGEFIKGKMWTGDKRLLSGLKKKGYKRIITTEELFMDFLSKEGKSRKK